MSWAYSIHDYTVSAITLLMVIFTAKSVRRGKTVEYLNKTLNCLSPGLGMSEEDKHMALKKLSGKVCATVARH